jgi:hypothetical protein
MSAILLTQTADTVHLLRMLREVYITSSALGGL